MTPVHRFGAHDLEQWVVHQLDRPDQSHEGKRACKLGDEEPVLDRVLHGVTSVSDSFRRGEEDPCEWNPPDQVIEDDHDR